MGVNLLAHPVGGLGTERSLVCLVTVDLPGDKLDLPALAVEDGKLLGRGRHRVEQVGDQPVELGMTLAAVFDDPGLNRLALAKVDQVTAVPQLAQMPPSGVTLDPPEQVGAGRGVEQPKRLGRKAGSGQHDHPRRQRVRQLARQGTLTHFVGDIIAGLVPVLQAPLGPLRRVFDPSPKSLKWTALPRGRGSNRRSRGRGPRQVGPDTLLGTEVPQDEVTLVHAYLKRLHTAQAVSARAVVLVEGISDRLALEALARRRGRNLDAEGISIVPMGGSKNIGSFLEVFGPEGIDVRLAGLCDAAE